MDSLLRPTSELRSRANRQTNVSDKTVAQVVPIERGNRQRQERKRDPSKTANEKCSVEKVESRCLTETVGGEMVETLFVSGKTNFQRGAFFGDSTKSAALPGRR